MSEGEGGIDCCTLLASACPFLVLSSLRVPSSQTLFFSLRPLRVLFQEGIIYTNVSSILVSVNPFKLLPLYTPEIMDKYRVNSREQPPHVFQVLTCVGTRVSVRCRKSA